jgi:hypothetical protein
MPVDAGLALGVYMLAAREKVWPSLLVRAVFAGTGEIVVAIKYSRRA